MSWILGVMALITAIATRKSAQEGFQSEALRVNAIRYTEQMAFRSARDAWSITTILFGVITITLILGIIF